MLTVALISPMPPAVGGMAVLAATLQKSLKQQKVKVITINTHPQVKKIFPYESTFYRIHQLIVYLLSLRRIATCDCALIISSSGDFFYSKALSALYVCNLFKCKIILDFVGGGLMEFTEAEKSRIFKKLKKFDEIIVPSSPFKDLFEKSGVPCTLFPHIVEIDRFRPSKQERSGQIFLSAKNLEEYSNIESIIKAFRIIKDHFSEARLLITGKGPQKECLKDLAKELDLRNVEFLENLKNEEMPAVFNMATVLLHATRIESFGITIVEALASGLPVIATNVGGIPDIIKDGVNGYLIDYDDHVTMASKAISILKNRDIYERFVNEGLSTAQQFSPEILGPKMKTLIEATISKE